MLRRRGVLQTTTDDDDDDRRQRPLLVTLCVSGPVITHLYFNARLPDVAGKLIHVGLSPPLVPVQNLQG